jgi:hypothetical protein
MAINHLNDFLKTHVAHVEDPYAHRVAVPLTDTLAELEILVRYVATNPLQLDQYHLLPCAALFSALKT